MPNNKPTIVFDFAQGRVAERLPEAAVVALVENRLPTRKLWHELSSLFRAKPIQEIRPRQVLEIVTRYVNVHPTNFVDMERVVGKSARHYLADRDFIPPIVWELQDLLDAVNKNDLGDPYRHDVASYVASRFEVPQYYSLVSRYLAISGYNTADVRAYGERTRVTNSRRPIPAA
jgi:hypothetical protein